MAGSKTATGKGRDCIFSVVIPTYRRGALLLDTLRKLFVLAPPPAEILAVDQTESHPEEIAAVLQQWHDSGRLRWLRLPAPSIPRAMNTGLAEARGEFVLFGDDDILPPPDWIARHAEVYAAFPEAWAVVGRILQPEDSALPTPGRAPPPARCRPPGGLRAGLDFRFNGTEPAWIENVMAGNLSVRRAPALAIGGFDENFLPPVSFRFETEFAKRMVAAGGKIRFEPAAVVRHLRVGEGGTRSQGSHLKSASPVHGVGDYYYALRCGRGWDRLRYILRRPFREVRTRFHLAHPWFIPLKLIGEIRALAQAVRLHRAGPILVWKSP